VIAFVLLLALLSAFPPLATDMYLPAIPYLERTWQTPLSIVNLTLVFFFVTYCCSMLVYGPLSDRFGRKPPLLTGLLLFIVASLLCAFSVNIWMLIGSQNYPGPGSGCRLRHFPGHGPGPAAKRATGTGTEPDLGDHGPGAHDLSHDRQPAS